jgi:hypothetical protein
MFCVFAVNIKVQAFHFVAILYIIIITGDLVATQ